MARNRGLKIHTVGFCGGASGNAAVRLQNMANEGKGKFRTANTEAELSRAFGKLASNGLVLDSLINQLAGKVSERVSQRILTDYL